MKSINQKVMKHYVTNVAKACREENKDYLKIPFVSSDKLDNLLEVLSEMHYTDFNVVWRATHSDYVVIINDY